MDSTRKLTPRERLLRILGGLGLAVVGCVVFAISQERDPENRWAIFGIAAIIIGLSWAGPGVRGRRDGPIPRDLAPPRGPPISAERTVAGLLLAWVLPGLGHWIIERRGKAILYFATITACFVIGVALAHGRNLSYERDDIWFLAYMFNAGETALGWLLTRNLELDHQIPFLQAGFLYTAVACLLNVVVMMDFVATCTRSAMAAPSEEGAA